MAWNGSVDHAAGYGMADLEQGTRIEPGSVFGLASISKQFTGTAAAILVERGELDLDADIREYIPELPAYERQIRVRDLVHMTSGLRWFHASFQDCMARGRHDDYSACTPEHDEFKATNAAGDTEFPDGMEMRIPLRVLGSILRPISSSGSLST